MADDGCLLSSYEEMKRLDEAVLLCKEKMGREGGEMVVGEGRSEAQVNLIHLISSFCFKGLDFGMLAVSTAHTAVAQACLLEPPFRSSSQALALCLARSARCPVEDLKTMRATTCKGETEGSSQGRLNRSSVAAALGPLRSRTRL